MIDERLAVEAGKFFMQEHAQLEAVELCLNYQDKREYQEMADACLDAGWELAEKAGFTRARDIAQLRKAMHDKSKELFFSE